MEEGVLGFSAEDQAEVMEEMNALFADFLEQELSDPSSELSQIYGELAAEEEVSDSRMKMLRDIANKEGELSPEEAWFVSIMAGRDDDGFNPFSDIGDDGGATREQLGKYAEYLRNYLYTYKDEARDIDPSIDPEEEHVGPMAQDIEKVAPDCVKETPEGVKTVDGQRLALVNAGVIGELARRVLELEARIGDKRKL